MAENSSPTLDPIQLEKYTPKPRGDRRIPGVDLDALDKRLAECSEFFTKHVDEADYRNLDWYLWRMQLHFAAGDDAYQILDDAFLAARCLHDRHEMHLGLKPPEMFMSRRITPVEVGILSGMPMMTMEFAATYGLPMMMLLSRTASEEVMSEAALMTSYFRHDFCADFVDLTGFAAVVYAGAIAAIGRGFDDEATVALATYAKARDSLRGAPSEALLHKLQRYDALNTALACLCAGQFDNIGTILAGAAEDFEFEQNKRQGAARLSPQKLPAPKYFDLSILTILALAALREVVITLPTTGPIAAYNDFIQALTQMPERHLEMPELDEEARKILEEAGVDPDKIAAGSTNHSFQEAKAESESRAAEIFEERQKNAQQAVREKILREAAEDAPQNHSGQGSYANFFDNLDENAIPKFDDGSDSEPVRAAKSFDASFFSEETHHVTDLKMTLDPEPEPEPEPESEPEPVSYEPTIEDNSPRRDFTSLFDEGRPEPTLGLRMSLDDEEDRKIRAAANAVSDVPEASKNKVSSSIQADRDAQIRELEEEQARKRAIQEELEKSRKIELNPEIKESEVSAPESYQDRMKRILTEKQAADRERALRMREEAARELEELQNQSPVAAEEEKTGEKETDELPEDFDMFAALAAKPQKEEQ